MADTLYSSFIYKTATLVGKTAKPANVTFNTPVVHGASGGIALSWNKLTVVDFEEYIIQLTPHGGWEDNLSANTEVFRGRATEFLYTASAFTPGVKTFLIRAKDTSGNYSVTAGSTTVTIAAPAWSSQTISHVINDGQITITWPIPAIKQFAVENYQVKYRTGNSSTVWAGALDSGHGTTEGVYSSTNSITFPVTWGKGEEGSSPDYRTFIVKAQDSLGNISSNEISKSIQIASPDNLGVSHEFASNDEGTKAEVRLKWDEPQISASQVPISHYKVYYKDYKTGATAPTWGSAGNAYLQALGTTEFKQEVDWGPSKTNAVGTISTTVTSYSSNDIRRYWIVPVDLAGNWGVTYSGGESDYIPEIEDVTVVRPSSITGLTAVDFSTKSSNGVVEINWNLPTVTTAPITSVRVFWEIPTWSANGAGTLTSTRGEKNSKAGTATKYSTPVGWGPTNGSGETTRQIYFVAYDSIGNISVPTKVDVIVDNPDPIASTALTAFIIDNNVILRWTDPAATSLPIASYDIYRCPSGGSCSVTNYATTSTFITNVGGTNTYSFFETAAGDYKYFVRTKDLAGNYSVPTAISTSVKEPRDFVVLADVDSKYVEAALTTAYCSGAVAANEAACILAGGTWIENSKAAWTNIKDVTNTSAILPVNALESWATHFIGTGAALPGGTPQYLNPAALITAGHYYYLKPEATATYYQQWDLGTVQTTGTITVVTTSSDFGPTLSDGQVVVGSPEIFISTGNAAAQLALYDLDVDNTTGWVSKGVGNNSVLGEDFRFVKVKVPYTSSAGALKLIEQQRMTLNLATIRDQSFSKQTVTNAANGKKITFNKTFQDITSIAVTPGLTGSCSGGGHTNRIACEEPGTCNNNSYTTRSTCEAAEATWTSTYSWSPGVQNTAIYDFNDIANPEFFYVYLLRADTGAFTTGDFTWQATGV